MLVSSLEKLKPKFSSSGNKTNVNVKRKQDHVASWGVAVVQKG